MEPMSREIHAFGEQFDKDFTLEDALNLLDENWLLMKGCAYEDDDPIPSSSEKRKNEHFRFHARRWLVRLSGCSYGVRVKLPGKVNDVFYQRWPK
jgi:predicted RNase H-like HicB family nuclease